MSAITNRVELIRAMAEGAVPPVSPALAEMRGGVTMRVDPQAPREIGVATGARIWLVPATKPVVNDHPSVVVTVVGTVPEYPVGRAN